MKPVVTRTISGIFFVLAMLGGLLFNKYIFAVLIMTIMSICMIEFYTMTLELLSSCSCSVTALSG